MAHEAKLLIVDENDKPIGAATRVEAWSRGLIHRIVHIMVEDGEGKILLQRRATTRELYPNRWTSSASGHVDEGEDWEQAAYREAKEEIGLTDTPLEVIDTFFYEGRFENKILKRFNKVFRTIVPPGTTFERQESEVSELVWFKIEAAKALPDDQKTPSLAKFLEQYY